MQYFEDIAYRYTIALTTVDRLFATECLSSVKAFYGSSMPVSQSQRFQVSALAASRKDKLSVSQWYYY